jgi:hypothetical protein
MSRELLTETVLNGLAAEALDLADEIEGVLHARYDAALVSAAAYMAGCGLAEFYDDLGPEPPSDSEVIEIIDDLVRRARQIDAQDD